MLNIPTEPIGSIPRPPELLSAIAATDGSDPAVDPLYEHAIRDTIEQFEATGSPVISDGEQRKYHKLLDVLCAGVADHGSGRLQDPVRRRPRPAHAAADRGAVSVTDPRRQLPGRGAQVRASPGQASRDLPIGVEPDVPLRANSRIFERAVHRRSSARARDRGSQLPAKGCASRTGGLHGGAARDQDRSVWRAAAPVHRSQQSRAVPVLG